jgi:pentatricopeptide repeat protein
VIDALGKFGNFELMLNMLGRMKDSGVQLNEYTYWYAYVLVQVTQIRSALINAFGKRGEFNEVTKYLEEMKSAGVPLNTGIFDQFLCHNSQLFVPLCCIALPNMQTLQVQSNSAFNETKFKV